MGDASGWVPLAFANTFAGVTATIMAVIAMWSWTNRRVQRIERTYQEREAALLARIDLLETQWAQMWTWARSQTNPPPEIVSGEMQRAHMALRTLFTREEIEVLASEIGIRLDDVGGETLVGVTQRLFDHASRRQLTDRLIAAIRRARPNAGV